jgi:hypothetical protein
MTDNPEGIISQSNALAEAEIDSLAQLWERVSTDPESANKSDMTRMVEYYREQRVKWAAAEAAGQKTSKTGGAKSILGKKAGQGAEAHAIHSLKDIL